MGDKGLLQRLILRRDRAKERWTYSVHDTKGVWDGDLGEYPIDGPFSSAADRLDALIVEHWQQPIEWTWVARADDQWASGPEIDGSSPGKGLAGNQPPSGQRFHFLPPKGEHRLERAGSE